MHKDGCVHVYSGNFGQYEFPDEVVNEAYRLNAGRESTRLRPSFNDGRTRGAKYLEAWGRARDDQERAALGL